MNEVSMFNTMVGGFLIVGGIFVILLGVYVGALEEGSDGADLVIVVGAFFILLGALLAGGV